MATQKILGLDLGVGSIGWALIETEDDAPKTILAMGSRIVPISSDDSDQFQKGQAITKNAERTKRRTARKGYDRYQQRRALLTDVLRRHDMLPERMDEHVIDLWKLRSDAATKGKQLTLRQIGRVLYHINQKRGYKHAKADNSADKKQTQYVADVNARYQELQELHQTIGQHFYEQLRTTAVETLNGPYYTFRIRDKVFPRQAYIAEFDQIMSVQRTYYPEVLTDELIDTLRNRIIFYQRPLKSCKHLVGMCEFEMRSYHKPDGSVVNNGPKCAPRTSPLAQLCALWETVNNITLTNRYNDEYDGFTLQKRRELVDFLCTHEVLKVKDLQKILGLPAKGWYAGKAIGKGLKGNSTLLGLRNALGDKYDTERLLRMNIPMQDWQVDTETGELIQIVNPEVENEPLFRLWHVVYSVQDKEELRKALKKQFDIDDDEVVENLYQLDFVKPGYANKSHKFIRKLLPLLMAGYKYSEACDLININHSNSLTKAENEARVLLDRLPLLEKNALRQPIIEKILNQMINVVNALRDRYGEIDEVRVELARELKSSKDERENAYKRNNENEKQNREIEGKIREMGIRSSRARIQKYKMWEESQHLCFYCGKTMQITDFLNGADVEIEHIIPRSVLFDDSYSNKVCACRECNRAKGNLTARDFMAQKPQEAYESYINRVEEAFKDGRISKTKHDHLLWTSEEIPTDFIDRQLRQSQYIAKKAVAILKEGFRNVYSTSGSVTDFLRHQWGYDNILHNLNLPRYRLAEGMTEFIDYDHSGQEHTEERIKNWSKRLDHRHHAVDALTIALTRQSMIQRLNNLTAQATQEDKFNKQGQREDSIQYAEKKSKLEKWVAEQPHFSVQEVTDKVAGILISFRAGKRVTTPATRAVYRHGKRIKVQTGLQVPRGPLSEETVYGKVGDKYVVKYPLNHPSMKVDDIVDPTIREIVRTRLNAFGGKAKDAFAEPLYSDPAHKMQIRSVRCYTGLQDRSVAPVRFADGEPIGFSKTGNNHHIAIYVDKKGKYQEIVTSFWQAVERKRYGIPVIIDDPQAVWDKLIDTDVPQAFLETLPKDDWQFITSLQVNEMFILGMDDVDYNIAIEQGNYQKLHQYLYRVQIISTKDYCFRFHTETSVDDKYEGTRNPAISRQMNKLKRTKSIGSFWELNPHKVRINILGEITAV